MAMDKIGNINLETTAQYQSLSNLNVQFWNQDKNTAVLQFKITRNDYPLSLSQENVKIFIALESGDSFLVDDNLNYVDELNGVVAYTIPNEFMRVATSVKGQVYVTTLDEEEVVVQRQFTFTVANDLIADLPAEYKIREIKYFSDMREEVAQMMEKLNNDFANMNDYVSQVNQTTQDGITALTNLINTKQKDYNDNHTAKMKELNDAASEYSTKFDDDKNYVDENISEFEQKVMNSDVVTEGEASNWQKYKLTDDDGGNQIINLNDSLETMRALNPGSYYVSSTPISASSTSGFLTMETRGIPSVATVKRITYKPYNSNTTYVMRYYDVDGWHDWENALANMETTQGAQAKANTAESNAKVYTNKVVSETNEVIFMGSAKNIGSTITLSKPYTDYDELKIFVYGHGGAETYIRDTEPNRKIIMHSFNITDSNASDGDIVETHIEKNGPTNLEITHAGSYNFPTNSGNADSTLGVEVYKIVGVRYHENLSQS